MGTDNDSALIPAREQQPRGVTLFGSDTPAATRVYPCGKCGEPGDGSRAVCVSCRAKEARDLREVHASRPDLDDGAESEHAERLADEFDRKENRL